MRRSKFGRVLIVLIATLATAVASLLVTGSPSSAATSSTPARAGHTVTTTAPMYKVHVKKLVSATSDKPGWGKIQLANGDIVPVPQADEKKVMSRAAQESGTTAGTVTGDCGSSFITVSDKPNHYPVAMQTGFDVYTGAIGYYWNASVGGPGYSHTYQSGGGLDFDSSWRGGYDSSQNLPAGNYTADVNFGIAYLWDDDVCISLQPSDQKFLTAPAKCLLTQRPSGAVNSGGGWIDNTVTAVAHRNITTTPNGPGVRAAKATACLRNIVGGTGAGGNITGWQDARKFAMAHGYNPDTDNSLARCHLIANVIGGRGIQANLAPCWQWGMNRTPENSTVPSMWTYESQVRDDARALGTETDEAVYFVVTPTYKNSASTIPQYVTMTAEVQHTNGTSTPLFTSRVVRNIPDANPSLNLGN